MISDEIFDTFKTIVSALLDIILTEIPSPHTSVLWFQEYMDSLAKTQLDSRILNEFVVEFPSVEHVNRLSRDPFEVEMLQYSVSAFVASLLKKSTDLQGIREKLLSISLSIFVFI